MGFYLVIMLSLGAITYIPMNSIEQCRMAIEQIKSGEDFDRSLKVNTSFFCIEGKTND